LCTILCTTYIFSTSQDYSTMCTILNKKVERFSVRH